MSWGVSGGLLLAAGILSGCATAFHDTAPAKDGTIYVVGERNGEATVWKCPATGSGDCEEVSVELK
jgi:predicted transglutaminase-like cysteine proteinase